MKNWEHYKTNFKTIVELAVQKVVLPNNETFYVVNGLVFWKYSEALWYANQWLNQERQTQSTSGSLGILGACD